MSVQRRKYDPDFKRSAVRLTKEPDRTVKEVAANLGISKDLLYKWRRELRLKEGLAFPGHGEEVLITEQEKSIKELEKKLLDAEIERDILKKPWPSSARNRNDISLHQGEPLITSGEEDVPGVAGFSKRLLSLVEIATFSKERRKYKDQRANKSNLRFSQ